MGKEKNNMIKFFEKIFPPPKPPETPVMTDPTADIVENMGLRPDTRTAEERVEQRLAAALKTSITKKIESKNNQPF
jgi:hypothetical protein